MFSNKDKVWFWTLAAKEFKHRKETQLWDSSLDAEKVPSKPQLTTCKAERDKIKNNYAYL